MSDYQPYSYKLFDLHTGQYILTDPNDSDSILTEEVRHSLLEAILPESAKEKLSIATIEMGMSGKQIKGNHPDPENNVLLLAKGSRGVYGPPEYKKLLEPYLDLVKDYPYQRYLTNENVSLQTKKLKIWVVDDESGISGVKGIDSQVARNILGDSHGKMSLKLADEMGSPNNLMQYRMVGGEPKLPFFAKGTFAPSLQNTLNKFDLQDNPVLQGIDLIVPTSSLKGISKQNLTPGVHSTRVHLTHHDKSRTVNFTLRSVVEKLDGDSFSAALKQQGIEIEKLNATFTNPEKLNWEFMKSLEPKTMPNPDNRFERIEFDPDRWSECGDYRYIVFRKDLESGHQQLVNSPVYAADKQKFYASRARKAAQLSFVKAKGGMIFCSSELKNNEICVPYLPEGAKVAAIRSPIIKLQDIALVENKIIDDINNDAGQTIEGAIVCSPQLYEQMLFQTRSFVRQQTDALGQAGVDTSSIELLDPFNSSTYKDAVLSEIEGEERESLTQQLNLWREAYNKLVSNEGKEQLPQLSQIRQDTFTSIIKGDFDGDNVAILSQQQYPEIYAGIEARITQSDSYTAKLDKIKVTGERELGDILAEKADPFIVGKTANLAENLQSFGVAAERVRDLGTPEQQHQHIKQIAPVMYYMLCNPTPEEIKAAEAAKVPSTYRFYNISSTGERPIDESVLQKFDAYGLDKALLTVYGGGELEPAVRERIFDTWQDLLVNLTDAAAQQNQIAVDTFKSERPVDSELVQNLTQRFKILDDGLKNVFKDDKTYLSNIPLLRDRLTNRAVLTQNVNNNLTSFEASVAPYKQIQGLFPEEVDEAIRAEVAAVSNEFDKLTSLSAVIRQKSRIDRGPSVTFSDGLGRSFEVTNLLSQDTTVDELRNLLRSGETNIRIEPNRDKNSSHKFFTYYSEGGNPKPLGTLCNACAVRLELDDKAAFELSEVNGFDFTSSSAVHLADSYSAKAFKLAKEFRADIPDNLVDRYAAATYNLLTDSTSRGNRLGFMFNTFGEELTKRLDELQLTEVKVTQLTGEKLQPGEKFSVSFLPDVENPGRTAVYRDVQRTPGATKLGIVDLSSYQSRLGATAEAIASFTPPSVADLTLDSGEQLTVGGMAKHIYATAGTVFVDEQLNLEIAPGVTTTTPILQVDGRTIGRLSEDSVAYLEDNQLLGADSSLNLSLTTVGKDYYKKIKAVGPNGRVLELVNVGDLAHPDFKRPLLNQQVTATVGFKTNKVVDTLYAYKEGKRFPIGEFNNGSGGSHRRSLDTLKKMGLYGKPFSAKLNSRLSVLNLAIDPSTITYPTEPLSLETELAKIATTEENQNTNYFLSVQQQYRSYGVIRQREFYSVEKSDVVTNPSFDVVIDRDTEAKLLAKHPEYATLDQMPPFDRLQRIDPSDPSIATESRKGFVVFSGALNYLLPIEIDELRISLRLERIEDLLGVDNPAVAAQQYRDSLDTKYQNVAVVEEASENFKFVYLPKAETDTHTHTASSTRLVEAIDLKNVLPDAQWQQLSGKLNYLDLRWLLLKLNLDDNLSRREIVETAFETENNLSLLKSLNNGVLTHEGELVYQLLQAGTDARYADRGRRSSASPGFSSQGTLDELKNILGEAKYNFYTDKAKAAIAANIIPVVFGSNDTTNIAKPFIAQRPQVTLPFPEQLASNQQPPIQIGGMDKFGLAINNPADHQNPDLERPITIRGNTYPSVQHAYSEIVNKDKVPFKQTYGLVKELMTTKLTQYPEILSEIEARGGYKWLYSCSHQLEGNDFWSGTGKESALIVVISSSMKQAKLQVDRDSVKSEKLIKLRDGSTKTVTASVGGTNRVRATNLSSNNLKDAFATANSQNNIAKSIQSLGQLDRAAQTAIVTHLDAMKEELNSDVSQYAKGRLNFWLGSQWNLKDKQFESSGVWNSELWELCKRVYPEADIALITYSGDETSAGINLHRDDSYAAFEARSISIETVPGAETKWQMKQTYPEMGWVKKQNSDAIAVDFSLPSGSITRFNCKNPHAAFPGSGRWSINLWKVSSNQRDNFAAHIASYGMDGGAKDWGKQLPSIPLPEPIVVTPQTLLVAPPLFKGNVSQDTLSAEPNPPIQIGGEDKQSLSPTELKISGKPMAMNYPLKTGSKNSLPVDSCFEAMRGYGRVHTSRAFEPYSAYGVKEGDIMLAYRGRDRELPEAQIALKVGKQYQITPAMLNDPQYQQQWSQMEKHAPQALPEFFAGDIAKGKTIWGMNFEPLGDYRDGKIYDFGTGKEITDKVVSTPYPVENTLQKRSDREQFRSSTLEIQLNSDQQKAKDGLLQWLNGNSSSQFATLSGAAGTGKSFLVQQILAEYKQQNPNASVSFTAPTHSAVRVLEKMSSEAGVKPDFEGTVFKLLGVTPRIDEHTGEQVFIQQGDRYGEDKIKPDLIVVDEGSMIGKNLYSLLQDAIAANTKVLIMGDKIQLPPVNEPISPAFADPEIEHQFELKQIMRYDGDLVATNDVLRQNVEGIMAAQSTSDLQPYLNGFNLASSADGQIETMKGNTWEQAVVNEFLSDDFARDKNHVRAIAYRNERVAELNSKIRNALYGDNIPQFVPGDLLITRAPSPILGESETLLNATPLQVNHATLMRDETTGYDVWKINYKLDDKNASGKSIAVVAKSSSAKFKQDLQDKWREACRHPKGSNARKYSFRQYYEHKNLFASVDYNYAITAHRAQGATYNKVAVDHNDFRVRLNHAVKANDFKDCKQALQEYYQLLYVAGTRARKGVMVADDSLKLFLKPIAPVAQKPAVPARNNIVSMISIPNLNAAEATFEKANANLQNTNHKQLKQKIADALSETRTQAQLLDSVKVWQSSDRINNANSLIANFNDAPDMEQLKYRAASIGRAAGQKAVIAFLSSEQGKDSLYSFNVPNHCDPDILRSKLKELGINSYTLMPTPKFTKLVISDRDSKLLAAVEQIGKNYDLQPRITKGTASFIPEREYDSILTRQGESNLSASSHWSQDRREQPLHSGSSNLQSGGNERRSDRVLSRRAGGLKASPLNQAMPRVQSPAVVQERLTIEAVPIATKILNNSPGKRQFNDGKITISYDANNKSLKLADASTSSLKMAATYDGKSWRSDPNLLGGMQPQDVAYLKSTLDRVLAQQNTVADVPGLQSEPKSRYFATKAAELESSSAKTYAPHSVER